MTYPDLHRKLIFAKYYREGGSGEPFTKIIQIRPNAVVCPCVEKHQVRGSPYVSFLSVFKVFS